MDEEKYFKKAGVRWGTVFGVFIVVFLLATRMVPTPELETSPSWHVIWEGTLAEATEANPGAGASGFLEIFFVNHSNTGTTTYDSNVSSTYETWCNASLDADGAAGTTNHAYAAGDNFHLELKHSTTMDIVVRARWNRTHAWDGSKFVDGDCRINITASGGGITISGATSGTNCVSGNETDHTYIWINCYWNNSNAGYTLNKGQTCTVSQVSIQAKY